MPKESKLKILKCPKCKHNKDVTEAHHDCPSCSCTEIFICERCWCEFDKKGEV